MARKRTAVSASEELLRRSDVAEILGMSPRTLESWGRDGRGPSFRRIGREALYLRSDLDAWILSQPAFGGVETHEGEGGNK